MPSTIWCNLRLDAAARAQLEAGTAGHTLLWAAEPGPNNPSGKPDPVLAQHPVDVVFGQPEASQCAELLARERPEAPRSVRWVHLSSAGYTPFDNDHLRSALQSAHVPLTTSSGVFAEPCAQHALALMLAAGRRLPAAVLNQHQQRGWPKSDLRWSSVLLRQQQVVLVGYGAIGQRLAELLRPFDVQVAAVRRRPRGDEQVPTHPIDQLPALLARADHVLDLLPGNAQTSKFFDAAVLGACKPGALFYNIGRGTTVDQQALIAALTSGPLAAAYRTSPTPSRCRRRTRCGPPPTASSRLTPPAATATRTSAWSSTSWPTCPATSRDSRCWTGSSD
jgi:phosphoglycerate dehydrogenase-like enzyme